MCYDIAYMTKRADRYARHYGLPEERVEAVKSQTPPVYHAQGFAHPDIPVLLAEGEFRLFHWGMVPFWTRDSKAATQLSNRTLNARGEEMFEKPAFRQSARTRRCLVVTDGFFEHYWEEGKSYPFYITHRAEEPVTLGGLWDKWENREGDVLYSVSIVTTAANALMKKIHNNPKASEGPRMPLVLEPEWYRPWVEAPDDPAGKEQILEIVHACNPEFLRSWPVNRLRGKLYPGNIPEILEPVAYEEMHDPTR